jgi:hypothetical protein
LLLRVETDLSFGFFVQFQGEREGKMAALRSSLRPCEAAEEVDAAAPASWGTADRGAPSSHLVSSSSTLAHVMAGQPLLPLAHEDDTEAMADEEPKEVTRLENKLKGEHIIMYCGNITLILNSLVQQVNENTAQTLIVPEVGQAFESEDKAYDM